MRLPPGSIIVLAVIAVIVAALIALQLWIDRAWL